MSEVDSSLIRRGYWINHSQDRVLGGTITVEQQYANFIIAILAILVSVATSSAWNLLLFLVHHVRSTDRPRDGLWRQQQVLLRTLGTPLSVVADLLKLSIVWKGNAPNLITRCGAPALIALSFSLGGIAVGVFSSYAVNITNLEVLVQGGSKCRTMYYSANDTFTAEQERRIVGGYMQMRKDGPKGFMDRCYGYDRLPSGCNFLVAPPIRSIEMPAKCPFSETLCLQGDEPAITFDSGYIDSHSVLGINARATDRVHVRKQTTCAPLRNEGYMLVGNSSNPLTRDCTFGGDPSELWTMWMFGSSGWPDPPGEELPCRATFSRGQHTSNNTDTYTLGNAVVAYSGDIEQRSTFSPIDEFRHDIADLTLLPIFTNMVNSRVPIEGPIYAAHRTLDNYYPGTWGEQAAYLPDEPGGIIGCTEQYEFCITNTDGSRRCTEPLGLHFYDFRQLLPEANEIQLSLLGLIGLIANDVDLSAASTMTSILDSANSVESGASHEIPNNQWVRDVRRLNDFTWAGLQMLLLYHATGYPSAIDDITHPPVTESEKHLCQSQKVVKPGGFANINVFALAFILSMSTALLLLDYGLLRGLILLKFKSRPKVCAWIEDGAYQLQRAAYEAHEVGNWTDKDNEVPVEQSGELLSNLYAYRKPSLSTQPPVKAPLVTMQSLSSTSDTDSSVAQHHLEELHPITVQQSQPSILRASTF